MTLQEVIAKADPISLGRVVYVSINGEEAVPVRSVIVDVDENLVHRIILTNTEGENNG